MTYQEYLRVIEVLVSILISVAGRRLVKTKNPSACPAVNCILCGHCISENSIQWHDEAVLHSQLL
jgi:hypothetical protein